MKGSNEHLKPLRLFDLARESGAKSTEEERKHLHECEQCQSIVRVFGRQFSKPPNEKPGDAA
jgi:hypothetical protein